MCVDSQGRVLTDVDRPPVKRVGVHSIWVERLLRYLQKLLRAHSVLVDASGLGVNDVCVCELDVKSDEVALSWDDHAGAVVRVNGAAVTDVREIAVWDHVDNAPDVVCDERSRIKQKLY